MKYKVEFRKGLYLLKPKYFNNAQNMYNFIDLKFSNNEIDYAEVYTKNENGLYILLDTHDN